MRERWRGEAVGHVAEAAGNGVHRQVEALGEGGGREDRHNGAGDARCDLGEYQDNKDGHGTKGERKEVGGGQVLETGGPFIHKMRRCFSDRQAEEVGDLGGEDNERDPAGEAHRYRIRDVFDGIAQARKAHDDENNTGHESRHGKPVVAVLLDDPEYDDDEGARRAADLHAAAGQGGNNKPRDNPRDKPLFRLDARGNGKGDRQRQGHDADNDPGEEVVGKA